MLASRPLLAERCVRVAIRALAMWGIPAVTAGALRAVRETQGNPELPAG